MNNQDERYHEGNPEMDLPTEETPEMGIVPGLQDSEAEIGEEKKGPEIGTVNDALERIQEEEREDEEREREIEQIKRKPTIH